MSQTNILSEPITVSIRLQTPLECDMFVFSLRYGLCFLVHFDCKSFQKLPIIKNLSHSFPPDVSPI